MYSVTIALELFTILIMAGILWGNIRERAIVRGGSAFFIPLYVLDIGMLAADCGSFAVLWRYGAAEGQLRLDYAALRGLTSCAYYAILSLFTYYVVDFISQKEYVPAALAHVTVPVCALFAAGWTLSCFSGLIFTVTDEAVLRGPLYWFGQVGGYLVAADLLFIIIRWRRAIGWQDALILLSMVAFPLASSVLRIFWPSISYMPLSISLTFIQMHNVTHLHHAKLFQRQELRLAQERMEVMLSQIRPHFIFNVLNSVYVLCDRDPQMVKPVINEFSTYLRANLEVLEDGGMIPVEKELAHVRTYLNLEQVRFREELQVSFDIRETGFSVPPLTIEPIVENAVKHGVLKKKGGGTVSVRTRRNGGCFEVVVEDDGAGFDVDAPLPPGRPHIGMANARERLRLQCRATVDVRSEPGAGTRVTISIPVPGGGGY